MGDIYIIHSAAMFVKPRLKKWAYAAATATPCRYNLHGKKIELYEYPRKKPCGALFAKRPAGLIFYITAQNYRARQCAFALFQAYSFETM